MTNEGGKTCPVCTEEMDLTDLQLKPCKCGYEVCVWCWHHIMDMAEKDGTEGRCPACRTPYDKEKIVSMTASVEINSDRKPKQQKVKSKTYEGRKHLSNVRVVQRHLVYTMGIPASLADEDVLQRKEYFGQYGKVLKASLTRTSGGAIQFSTNNTCSVYITYSKEEEAVRCIQSVSGFVLQGQSLRACFGTTKYCHAWLRNMPCNNPECVYLHDVGSQEDSFTKDEIVSGCTRSRVQQITGLMINLGKTGSVLPPPVDDSYISGTALSKPISRSPSDTPSIQLKGSPPNSSTSNERSISLPAAASWGLRVSNGHQPTATSSCSDGTSKQKHEDYNGSVGFPSLVASATPPSMLHSDVGKKAWVTKDSRASQSSKEVASSDYSKQYQYAVTDRQKIVADTPGEIIQDAASSDINSRDDHCIQGLPITGCSIENDPQSCLAYSDKGDNIGLNGEVPSVCSGLSLVGNDCYIGNEHSEATEPSTLVSDQLFRSLRNHGLHQSYPELARGNLSPVLPKEAVSDSAFASREPSNWGSGLQTQALQDTCGEDDLLALGEQNSNFSEVCHPLHLPSRSSSINISNSSNGQSWSSDYACGPSDPVSRDHRYAHTKSDDIMIPFTSSDAILLNGYTENNVRSSTGLEKTFEQSSLFSSAEKGKYPGRFDNNPVGFEKNTSVDMGENSIISNILSMDFDTWGESLASPHNFAKLLSETDEQIGGLKISSRKEQKSNQSRFSFARQVESADHGTDSHFSRNFGSTMSTNSASQVFQDNRDMHIDEFSSGLSSPFLEESDTFYSGNPNFPSNRFSASRAPVSAPPGFSIPSKVPPPGFSIHERMDKSFDSSSANHFLGSSSLLRNQYHAQPNNEITSIDDVELIDPAILAVGTGRPANGMNDFRLDIRSTPLQLGASETDPRIQLLRQQFLPPQQNYSYSNHIGDRYSPLADAYNSSSRFLDQSQYAQLPLQPRAERLSHGWSSWNESQRGNDLGAADFFKSERFGLNQYFPDYDNRNSRMPKPSDIYNRAFGM